MTHPYKAPVALLDELGITEPSEINIEAIAQHCGATVVYERLTGCEARILGVGERAIITVNSTGPRERQRFSAAHELGHWMRDRGKIAFSCTDRALVREWDEDNPERRANRFAAEILLPAKMLQTAARSKAPIFSTVSELAETFGTSLTATAIRLIEKTHFPSMIVCCDANKRVWFKPSQTVPSRFWPQERPGGGTIAAQLLQGKTTPNPGPTAVDADEWINVTGAEKYTIVEDSVRIATGHVLSLLWWKDEAQILEADDDDRTSDVELSGVLEFGRRTRRR